MSSERELFLLIQHATVRYLDKILFRELSFRMHEGEHWAITGKSGAGKTTLLQTILGRYNVVNGRIHYPFYEAFIREHHITDPLFTYRHLIAFVSQQPHFRNKQNMPDFYYQQRFHSWDSQEAATVREYIDQTFAAVNVHLLSGNTRFTMDWVIQHLSLGYLLNKTLIQLSNGETRRLLIAQALLQQPLLLMLDNPFTGLDTASRVFFHKLLTQIVEKGTQLVLVTSAQEMPDCITHVIELDGGEIISSLRIHEYLQLHKHQENISHWLPDKAKLARLTAHTGQEMHSFNKAVKMQHIHVQYGETVILNDINWEINRGEKWALLGPNGAGKSTLLSLLSGDNPQAYANTIYLFDRKRGSGESIWDIKRKIGFVSPEMHQYFHSNSNCLDIVLSGYSDTIGIAGKKITDQQRSLASAWMELLEITGMQDKRFKEVSAGKQRLILLIRALVKNPPLLILDEPCQGLDEEQKAHFKSVIEQVCNDTGKTLIYVTHYAEEIPGCVQHVLQLNKGQVVKNA